MSIKYPFKNLVFEGGGVKGLAYVGALQVLEEKGILENIERVGGTSAGAITACLLAIGFEVNEIHQILEDLDFAKFKDGSDVLVADLWRLFSSYGLYKGNYFHDWIRKTLKNKTGLDDPTFREFHQFRKECDYLKTRDFYLMATNLSTNFGEVFSNEHTPQMRISDALRMSMSIPLFFSAVRAGEEKHLYVDGGVLNNFPIQLFDHPGYLIEERVGECDVVGNFKNHQTLGLRLDTREEIEVFRNGKKPIGQAIDNFKDYASALIATLMAAQENRHLDQADWNRTVYINTLGIKTTDFELSSIAKSDLLRSGKKGSEDYFTWWDGKKPLSNVA